MDYDRADTEYWEQDLRDHHADQVQAEPVEPLLRDAPVGPTMTFEEWFQVRWGCWKCATVNAAEEESCTFCSAVRRAA